VTAALCLDNTFPLSLPNPLLNATDWSGGWQLLFRSSQLAPASGGLQIPFALLPPIVNAPPTIAGLLTTVLSAGVNDLASATICRKLKSAFVNAALCSQPTGLSQLMHQLLSELTLAGSSQAVQIPLVDPSLSPPQRKQLETSPISAVGLGNPLGLNGSLTERAAYGASFVMSIATQLVLPAIQLIGDDDQNEEENHDVAQPTEERPAETAAQAKEAETERSSIEDQISSLEHSLPSSDEISKAQTEADRAITVARGKPGDTDPSFWAGKRDAEQAKVTAAEQNVTTVEAQVAAGTASQKDLQHAKARLAGYRGWVTRYENARAATQKLTDLNDTRDEIQQKVARAKSKLANQPSSIRTTGGLIAQAFSKLLEIALEYPHDIAQAYAAIKSGNPSAVYRYVKPIENRLLQDAAILAPLAVNDAIQYGEGALVGTALKLCPPCTVFDTVSNLFGYAQNVVDLAETLTIPPRHDYPAIKTNYRRGSTPGQLAKLYLGAIPAQALAGGVVGVAANALLGKLTGQAGPFVTNITTVCPDTVIVPDAYVSGRVVGILNISNLADLHLAAGFGSIKHTASLGGKAVSFAVVQSLTPLGAGGASFADPPAQGSTVHVSSEGEGLDYRDFNGRVVSQISSGGQPVVEFVAPDRGTRLASSRPVGGFVYSTTGRSAGQLVGLAEDENGGQLVVLTGPGVADVTSKVPECVGNPLDELSQGG
jgi:hypothetical protein